MKALIQPLLGLAEFTDIKRDIQKGKGIIQIDGCVDSQKAHLIYGLASDSKQKLIITADELKAKTLYEDYRFYDDKTFLYPAKDLIFYQADIHGNLLVKQRMQVIKSLLEDEETTVITSIAGCMDRIMELAQVRANILVLKNEDNIAIEQLTKDLVSMGYERSAQVEAPGQFSVRGGIVDVFSITEANPWRIELWGDEIDSIRSFDGESQRSIEHLESIRLYPMSEIDFTVENEKSKAVSFLEYFDEHSLVIIDEPNHILEQAQVVETEFKESLLRRQEKDSLLPIATGLLKSVDELKHMLNKRANIAVSTLEAHQKAWEISKKYQMTIKSVNPYNNSFPLLVKDLKRYKQEGYQVVLLAASRSRAKRLAKDLQDEGLSSFYSEDSERLIKAGEIKVIYGHTHRGFEYPLIKFVVITEQDIFGKEKRKRRKKREYSGEKISSFTELSIGDYVVHEKHGLGIYRGIEKVETNKIIKDYIKVEYAKGSNLYILATQLEFLQKYAGAESRQPKLNSLGGSAWTNTRARVKKAVKEIAKDLVKLYATRQENEGYVYGPDTVWQNEFEELFPFEETEDQLLAIEAAKRDMQSKKIMDRLICGDVGYGKTEIAIRIAFKAMQEGKQVVYLVPTTILAQQHYNTFVQRMKDFPVRVDLLCRFRTPTEQKKTVQDLKSGLVDIVVGTHRVLSSDIQIKNLGLLIIDEEQRFGVTHKEKIKKLKENVDVMTLTATPIPRTLHMSLVGIRDMSVLEEAPQDRVPIQTFVSEYSEEMVREAISRELTRGGQVYYVYNRVRTIDKVAAKIAELIPEANVAYAHGQMKERELEKIMYDFINNEIDVLVSTTIIETGLDISNVNTIIIHDSDQLGLSQLYQLRGRVGRSNRTAYAFLLYKRDKMLKEVAEKRLHAIREYTELGSGFKIAMRDLEIRGAGNLLGAEQHGHMEAVGYDLFCKMLNEAVRIEKGLATQEDFETTIDLNVDAFIPATYITSEFQKLDIYKRIASIENKEEYEDILEELMDRFGEPPKAVQNLLKIAELKALAHRAEVIDIKQTKAIVKISMYEKAALNPAKIPELLDSYQDELSFKAIGSPYFLLKTQEHAVKSGEKLVGKIREFVEELLSFSGK
jgi:transcription-repair coupling factor (mfd)